MEEINYVQDLSIDPHNLDEELLNQPVLYMRYSELAAQAQKDRDRAKEKLDVVRAEQDKAIREKPELYGLAKVTEAAVSSAILKTGPYQEANNNVIETSYQLNLYNAARSAFDHRKKALDLLVQLLMANYFVSRMEPKAIAQGKRMVDISRDQTSDRQREGLNKKKEGYIPPDTEIIPEVGRRRRKEQNFELKKGE